MAATASAFLRNSFSEAFCTTNPLIWENFFLDCSHSLFHCEGKHKAHDIICWTSVICSKGCVILIDGITSRSKSFNLGRRI